jgi:hypothetical protein
MKLSKPASFPAIWEALDRYEHTELVRQLFIDGHTSSYTTVRNWARNKSIPNAPSLREGIAKTVSKFLGVEVSSETLFEL